MANHEASHYRTGEPIRAGDRVAWAGSPGRVLFVLGTSVPADRASEAEGFATKCVEGFLLDIGRVGLVFECESGEDLTLVARAWPPECS